jgi:hypothetical protein
MRLTLAARRRERIRDKYGRDHATAADVAGAAGIETGGTPIKEDR